MSEDEEGWADREKQMRDCVTGAGSRVKRQAEWFGLLFACFVTLFAPQTNSHVFDWAAWKQPLRRSIGCRWSGHLCKFTGLAPLQKVGLGVSAHGRYIEGSGAEKLNLDGIVTKASADATGCCSGAPVLQNCPQLKQGDKLRFLCHYLSQS